MLGSNRPLGIDKRKLAVTVAFVKYVAVICLLHWTGVLAQNGLAFLYLAGGVVFASVLCFEPYYDSLPKKITHELFRQKPGFGFSGKYVLSSTVSQYQKDGKHYVAFYWLPYNWLYVQLMRFKWLRRKTLSASYGNRLWSFWVVLIGLRYYKAHTWIDKLNTIKALSGSEPTGAALLTELMWEFDGLGMKTHSDLKVLAADLAVHHYR